ncbi:MAG: GNAT family N-acetyltransferase [Verrucomicrobiales bacterium]|nr:GNAT family N-acetyltransferase [Verrucomicrobiales bacterium]
MQTHLVDPEDPRWTETLLGLPHEFYHLPEYVRLEAGRMQGTAKALYAQEGDQRFLLPLVLREVPSRESNTGSTLPWVDAVSPYGYAGPLVVAPPAVCDEFLERALLCSEPMLRESGVIAVFVRLSPLSLVPGALGRIGQLVAHGPCFWLNLEESQEELQSQLRPRYRSYLNALRRDGVSARFVPFASKLDEFMLLYHQTMQRVGAAEWYYFSRDFYQGLAAALGDSLKLCVVELGGKLLAAGVFIGSGGIVQYYLSGVDQSLGQPHATKLMMITVRDWAKSAGYRRFNLGGGVGAHDDALSQFKRGFTKHSAPFHSWRWVTDETRYTLAVRAWEARTGVPADPPHGYFPAYRRSYPPAAPAASIPI